MTAVAAILALLGAQDNDSSSLVDDHLRRLWKKQDVRPAPLADDMEYLRRVTIDLVGEVPTPDEVRAFRRSERPDKRWRHVEELFQEDMFSRSWSERMTNFLLGYPRQFDYFTDRKGFVKFLQDRLKDPDASWDDIAREILTASSEANVRAIGFFSQFLEFNERNYGLKVEQVAGRAANAFLGVKIQCAQCHGHPFDRWTQEDFTGLAGFFAKTAAADPDGGMFSLAIRDRKKPLPYAFEGLQGPLKPRFLDGAEPRNDDWRSEFARMAIAHPNFAKAFVNRVWGWFFGKGIVDPLDDLSEARKPVAPELLDALAQDFVKHGYRIRHLIRTIVNSEAYQRTSRKAADADGRQEKFFARARIRPMTPEQLFHSISLATGLVRAYQDDDAILDLLGGQNMTGESKKYWVVRRWFIDMVVKTSDEAATTNFSAYSANIQQILYALNKDLPLFAGTKSDTGGRLHRLIGAKSDAEILEEIFLATVSRSPAERERARCEEHLKKTGDKQKAFEEVFWALLNTDEFIFNH